MDYQRLTNEHLGFLSIKPLKKSTAVVAMLHRLHDGVLVYGANNFYMCKMPGGGRKKATS